MLWVRRRGKRRVEGEWSEEEGLEDLFFFQAEDGIRDHCVTGVQTCALPIFSFLLFLVSKESPSRF